MYFWYNIQGHLSAYTSYSKTCLIAFKTRINPNLRRRFAIDVGSGGYYNKVSNLHCLVLGDRWGQFGSVSTRLPPFPVRNLFRYSLIYFD